MKIEVTGNHPNAILSLQSECDADLAYLSQIQSQLTTAKSDYLRMNRGDGSSRLGVRLEPTPEAKAGIEERMSNMTIDQALRYLPADAMARSQLENLRRMLAEAQEKARRPSPVVRSTHTFAKLPVSAAAFDEIAGKLREADYGHCFVDDVIDMHGIALQKDESVPSPASEAMSAAKAEGQQWAGLGVKSVLTDEQRQQILHDFILVLNQALKADLKAMTKIIEKKFPCNLALADHPTIQCGNTPEKDGEYEIGPLGLINGLVEPVTRQRIMAIYHDGVLHHFEQWFHPGFPT